MSSVQVGMGRDHTLFALVDGNVKISKKIDAHDNVFVVYVDFLLLKLVQPSFCERADEGKQSAHGQYRTSQ